MAHHLSEHLAAARTELHDRAALQGGAFRRRDLEVWGMNDATLRALVRRRVVLRLRHGLYTDARVLDAARGDERRMHLLDLSAAILSLDHPAFAFGQSAALLHGLPMPGRPPGRLDLVRPAGSDLRALTRPSAHEISLPDLRVRTHGIDVASTLRIEGIPVVSRILAAISAAAQSSPDWAVGILDSVLWAEADALSSLRRELAEWPMLKGSGTVRRALDLARPGAQTILESLSRVRLCRAGLPEPQLQVPLYDDNGLIGIVDMDWPDLGVVGEADGALKYTGPEVIIAEKAREDRIRGIGREVVRWGWADAQTSMDSIAALVWSAARRAA